MPGNLGAPPMRTVAVLVVAAVLAYVPLVGWGLPHATAPDRIKTFATDEILPLEALAEMRSTFVSAAPDRNFGYPWWHYFVVSAVQAPYLAVLWVTGEFSKPTADFPYGLRDPVEALEMLTILGRLVSVGMAAGIVACAFLFARTLWGRLAGTVSAVLTLLSLPMFYYGRTGNLDVPAFFWSAAGLVALARMMVSGVTTGRAVSLGCLAACAIATKDQAVVLFLPLAIAPFLRRSTREPAGPLPWRALASGVAAAIATYVVTTGMAVDPQRHLTHVYSLLFDQARVTSAAHYFTPAPAGLGGTRDLLIQTMAGLGDWFRWPVLIAAALGAVLAIRESRWHAAWLVPFLTTFCLLVRIPGGVVLRYFLPLTLFVDAFAALLLVRLRSRRPWLFRLAFGGLIALRLAAGVDLSLAQWHDTRYVAAGWLEDRYNPGDRLEYFGVADTLPALPADLVSRRIMGRDRWTGETGHGPAVLDYLRRAGPRFVIVIPDWTSGRDLERSRDCPPEVFAALLDGSAGYTLAADVRPPVFLPPPFGRPTLDNPSVAPPVRIFERQSGSVVR